MLIGTILALTCCGPPIPPTLKDYVSFKIAGINIVAGEGNNSFSNLRSPVNLFVFTLPEFTLGPFRDDFILSEVIRTTSNKLYLDELDTKKVYTYEVIAKDRDGQILSVINLYDYYGTFFINKTGNVEDRIVLFGTNMPLSNQSHSPVISNRYDLSIRTGTTSELTLNYDFKNHSVFQVYVEFNVNDEVEHIVYPGEKLFNYNAEWKDMKRYYNYDKDDYEKKLNIVFMADGYSGLKIFDYERYVEKLVNDLRDNRFFNENWDNINIIRMDTLSLEKTENYIYPIIGTTNNFAYQRTNILGDRDRIRKLIQTSFVGGPFYIKNEADKPVSNIDVIVVVKKDGTYATTQTYNGEIAFKNGQPVNIIVMDHPANDYIRQGKLAHLMGHAIARLQDESYNACNFLENDPSSSVHSYYDYYRNTNKESGALKWGDFITKYGYGNAGMNDGIIVDLYSGKYRIPTEHSIMSFKYVNNFREYGKHYGPVNRYHMEASYGIRTESIKGKDGQGRDKTTDLSYGVWAEPYRDDYEWVGYKIDDFIKKYSPNYFLYD
jgi:hypothetical protein